MKLSKLRPAAPLALATAALALAGSTAPATAATHGGHGAGAKATGAKKSPGKGSKKKPRTPSEVRGAMLSGRNAPTSRTGAVGDFYLRTSNQTLYGPKTRRSRWGRPTSLVGAAGPQGAAGAPGATGLQGPAGTPAFGAPTSMTFPSPVALSATTDDEGYVSGASVTVGTVTIPAGLAYIQLRLTASFGPGWNGNSMDANCGTDAAGIGYLGGVGTMLTATGFTWTWNSQPVTAPITCSLYVYDPSTPNTTITANLAGSQIAVFPVAIPAS